MQAAIAACHMRARTAAETDWPRIVQIYDLLLELSPSPVIALNRVVAISMAAGPAAGLKALDAIPASATTANYHLFPSVRGDFLLKLDRSAEARVGLERAISLTQNTSEQQLLRSKLQQIA